MPSIEVMLAQVSLKYSGFNGVFPPVAYTFPQHRVLSHLRDSGEEACFLVYEDNFSFRCLVNREYPELSFRTARTVIKLAERGMLAVHRDVIQRDKWNVAPRLYGTPCAIHTLSPFGRAVCEQYEALRTRPGIGSRVRRSVTALWLAKDIVQ